MNEIVELLEQRKKQLYQWKNEKEIALRTVPEGFLRISSYGDKVQYYFRNNPKDYNGVYIKEKDISLAQKLAQKDYDTKVLQAVDKELKLIERFQRNYQDIGAEQIYSGMHEERQKLIHPIIESDEEYVKKWNDVEYTGNTFWEDVPELFTAKGERVRSKSEVIIADLLEREGIPYHYEYPLWLKGKGKVFPDFTVLNVRTRKEIYWEHLGMMDDNVYVENAIQKINSYIQNGIYPGDNLILTYETKKIPINPKVIRLMIRKHLLQDRDRKSIAEKDTTGV